MQGCVRWFAAAIMIGAAGRAVGQEPIPQAGGPQIPWKSAQYSHIAEDEQLSTLLREFAADQGVNIVVSEKVQGKIRGRFGPMPPQRYLDVITRQNGLIWYYDGTAVFVYRGDELESEIFQLRRVQSDAVLAALRDLDVPVDKNAIRISSDKTLMHVIGAPRFVQIVRNIGLRLEGSAVQKVATSLSVRIFPLRHAWAEDQAVSFREAAVVIPGVASILRNLVGITSRGPQGGGGVRKSTPLNLPTLAGSGLISYGDRNARPQLDTYVPPGAATQTANAATSTANVLSSAQQQQQAPSVALESEQGQVPSIQAEPRLNAVIIQDSPDRFPVYESLIASLDVPVGIIEIEAMMIDVASNKNFSFGLPYNFATQDGANSMSLQVNTTDQANMVFTLVTGGVQRLLLNLQALAATGHAKVVGRPAVLTLDNIEASLESTQTIYVRVPGTYANDLFNIVVGTTLRVTPHIIDDGGQRKIKLQVRVEDGTPLPATVDAIPTIQRNSINTQAVLAEDQSLFIGGLAREERNNQERGIPWLKDIPKIGMFFRSTISTTVKNERYVLLTPRIISLEPPAGISAGVFANGGGACENGGAESGLPTTTRTLGTEPPLTPVPVSPPTASMALPRGNLNVATQSSSTIVPIAAVAPVALRSPPQSLKGERNATNQFAPKTTVRQAPAWASQPATGLTRTVSPAPPPTAIRPETFRKSDVKQVSHEERSDEGWERLEDWVRQKKAEKQDE